MRFHGHVVFVGGRGARSPPAGGVVFVPICWLHVMVSGGRSPRATGSRFIVAVGVAPGFVPGAFFRICRSRAQVVDNLLFFGVW